jgi:hypothetical protein
MDAELEARIDRVGRQRVFYRMAALGWTPGSRPPKWAWGSLVDELEAGTRPLPIVAK